MFLHKFMAMVVDLRGFNVELERKVKTGVQWFLPPPPMITTDKNRIRFLLTKLWHYNVTLKLGSLQWRERETERYGSLGFITVLTL